MRIDRAGVNSAVGRSVPIRTFERTKPALALGMEPTSLSAINNVLPATIIKLRRANAARLMVLKAVKPPARPRPAFPSKGEPGPPGHRP
jgi:hypothetical protein